MSQKKNINRRNFLKTTAAAAAGAIGFPYFVPARALGKDGSVAPSERITMGLIGCGNRGTKGHMATLAAREQAQILAVCDPFVVDEGRAALKDFFKHGHVFLLTFDGVGKESVYFMIKEFFFGNFLYPQYDFPGSHVITNESPRRNIIFLWKKSFFRFLQVGRQARPLDDLLQVLGN